LDDARKLLINPKSGKSTGRALAVDLRGLAFRDMSSPYPDRLRGSGGIYHLRKIQHLACGFPNLDIDLARRSMPSYWQSIASDPMGRSVTYGCTYTAMLLLFLRSSSRLDSTAPTPHRGIAPRPATPVPARPSPQTAQKFFSKVVLKVIV